MKYGTLPKVLNQFEVSTSEMFFYQDMLVKMKGTHDPIIEERLKCFEQIIGSALCDFIADFGLNAYMDSYVYISAKHLFNKPGCPFNRPGYHSDGFMSTDINYVWCDKDPTIFNVSDFNLSQDDAKSIKEMERQALKENEVTFPVNTLLRLNQYQIHKVADVEMAGLRKFLKISISADKFDLIGNTHNYLIDYNWELKPRSVDRNIPQSVVSKPSVHRHPVEL